MTNDDLFTRDEALGGLPAQRASTLLYLIESRTAHLAARSRWVMEPMLSETGAQERELAFVEAFALGREPPLRPTVQLLERYAPQWAPLAPENPALRATLAHLLGQKYRLDAGRAPNIRAALGLDQEAVQRAYQRQYQRSIEAIYAPQMALSERLRWAAARAAGLVGFCDDRHRDGGRWHPGFADRHGGDRPPPGPGDPGADGLAEHAHRRGYGGSSVAQRQGALWRVSGGDGRRLPGQHQLGGALSGADGPQSGGAAGLFRRL